MASEAAPVCEVDAVAGHRVGGPRLVTEHQRDHNDLARRYLPTTLNYRRRRQVPGGASSASMASCRCSSQSIAA